jgi:hypothetical protein
MSINWKVCADCGKKVNEVAEKCPYCSCSSFEDYENIKEDNLKNDDSPMKDDNASNNDSLEKIKGDIDKFSNDAKKMGNDFIYDNLPEEYADKLTEDISNFSKTAQQKTNEFFNENEQVINIKKELVIFQNLQLLLVKIS